MPILSFLYITKNIRPSAMKIFVFLFFALAAVSCNNTSTQQLNKSELAGGTLRYNEGDGFTTLFPPSVKDIVSTHIISQIHLGLVKYDARSLTVLPAIATDWDLDNSGTIYTFKINTNARFRDDKCFKDGEGRRITADDFRYTFEYLSAQADDNKNFFGTVDKILGAKEFYKESVGSAPLKSITGIKVINDSTLQLTIDKPYDLFIYYLANPSASVLAHEAVEMYGNKMLVGAGPYKLLSLPKAGDPIVLLKNTKYFMIDAKGKSLPYLDSIVISTNSSQKTELRMFSENQLDIALNINSQYINEFLDENISKFEKNPPEYILTKSERMAGKSNYNLLSNYVQNFYTNKMDFLDFSVVYLQAPTSAATTSSSPPDAQEQEQ